MQRKTYNMDETIGRARYIASWVLLIGLVGGVGIWWLIAKEDFVTLDVKDAEPAAVLREMSRQTGRAILIANPPPMPKEETPPAAVTSAPAAATNAAAVGSTETPKPRKVTARFTHRPLDDAMDDVAEQAGVRFTKYFALASSRASLGKLKADLLKGEMADGWNSLLFNFLNGRSRLVRGQFSQLIPVSSLTPISYEATAKPLSEALDELSQRSRGTFIADDHVKGNVTVRVTDQLVDEVVSLVAKQVHARVEKFYVVRTVPRFGARGGSPFGTQSPRWMDQQDKELEARIAAMPDDQRAQAEKKLAEWRERAQNWQSMSPLQMQQTFSQALSDPNVREQMLNRGTSRLLATTPEQRVERDKRWAQRRQQQGNR